MVDVLSYGVLCVDQMVRVAVYPELDGHARILEEGEYAGGEAANSAVALARLGISVCLKGNEIGADRRGRLFLQQLRKEVGTSGVVVEKGVETPHAMIVASADGHRTIFGSFVPLRSDPLSEADLAGVRLLSVDPFLGRHAVCAAYMAKARGLLVCSIEVHPEHEIVRCCDVIINSEGWVRRHGWGDPETIGTALLRQGVQTVVFTRGAKGCLVMDREEGVFEHGVFTVNVVDSTGAGDAFRAGLIYGMLKGWDLRRRIRFASAEAALNCRGLGGWPHAPDRGTVEALLCQERKRRRGGGDVGDDQARRCAASAGGSHFESV